MSYALHPGMIRTPPLPYPFYVSNIGQMWLGADEDRGFVKMGSILGSKHVIVEKTNLLPSVKVNGRSLKPQFDNTNGFIRWGTEVYYTMTYGWVYITDAPYPGFEPIEYSDRHYKTSSDGKSEEYDYTEWGGNSFYTFNSFPSEVGATVNLTKRGKLKGRSDDESSQEDEAVTLEFEWPRWESDEEFGKYEAEGGATGTRMFGVPSWKTDGGEIVYRSVRKKSGYFTYGSIVNDSGHWVIGSYNSSYGWYEGQEPQPDQDCEFKWVKGPDFGVDDEVPKDIKYTWKGYAAGDEDNVTIVGEVSKWR